MRPVSTDTLRILAPAPGIYAYYDGRIPGRRLWGAESNWLDDTVFSLGLASYAIVDDGEALVYDTHMSLAHARRIRAHLEGLGVARIQVALSHWHDDHVAGNAVFADCPIIALERSAQYLEAHREQMARATPPIDPLVMPTRLFGDRLELAVGSRMVELRRFEIHTADGNVLYLPDARILLAGDTLEDPVTYINEPERVPVHLAELDRLAALDIDRILPNHGSPDRIAAGGYDRRLIRATQRYLRRLLAGTPATAPLAEVIAEDLAAGILDACPAYDEVHRQNVRAMAALSAGGASG